MVACQKGPTRHAYACMADRALLAGYPQWLLACLLDRWLMGIRNSRGRIPPIMFHQMESTCKCHNDDKFSVIGYINPCTKFNAGNMQM